MLFAAVGLILVSRSLQVAQFFAGHKDFRKQAAHWVVSHQHYHNTLAISGFSTCLVSYQFPPKQAVVYLDENDAKMVLAQPLV